MAQPLIMRPLAKITTTNPNIQNHLHLNFTESAARSPILRNFKKSKTCLLPTIGAKPLIWLPQKKKIELYAVLTGMVYALSKRESATISGHDVVINANRKSGFCEKHVF